jgi:hypothetical protein
MPERSECAGRECAGDANPAALGAADWLCLAAAPTFAIMALLTAVLGGGPRDMLCAAAPGASPLHGMVPMYLLMSAFHAAPWLRLIAARRHGPHHVRQRRDDRTSAAPCEWHRVKRTLRMR